MEQDHLTRKLAVILHADVVGSTLLVQQNETLAHERIQAAFHNFSDTIKTYGGIARELRGDALVAEFERASDAVPAALAFQVLNEEINSKLDDDIQPQLRIGISLGEVIIADNTITGAGVVLAQRLEQLADPGGVVVQGSVSETVPARMPFEFESLGEQMLKGFDQPVRAFAARLQPGKELPAPEIIATPQSAGPEGLQVHDKPSIAVLPFTNMSDDPEQEYFSDGITEDITTALSYFTDLFVIARNSSFSYKGQSVEARQIARELGVRYLLEGSVRRLGNRIRINSQLINAITGGHIWAERFDGNLDDIFELQDEITRKIVASIAPQIELAEVDRSRDTMPNSLSSYELSLKAKSQVYDALRAGNADRLQQAIDTAYDVLKVDSRNTHALWVLGIAQICQYLYHWGSDPSEARDRALQATGSLIQADPSNADGHGLSGMVRIYRREFDQAIADFTRALSLNPNSAINLIFAAEGEALAGSTAMAREHAELALRLSPRDLDLWLGCAYLALTLSSFAEADFEEAIKWGHLSIQLHSKAPIRRALMVASCAYTGDFEQAVRHTEELKIFSPDFIPAILRGDMPLYKMPEHNKLLVDGLHKAGFKDKADA
jgi:TolB-like protein/class 3 adenylate cyclase/lipopolysaccharide biosynthesis regulator YciM